MRRYIHKYFMDPAMMCFHLAADLGGSLGLAVGASILSFAEIFYFMVKLLGILLKNYPERS